MRRKDRSIWDIITGTSKANPFVSKELWINRNIWIDWFVSSIKREKEKFILFFTETRTFFFSNLPIKLGSKSFDVNEMFELLAGKIKL